MKEYQTPQKEHSRLSNRRSKDSQWKNTRNVTKKSLELALDPSLSVSSEPFLFSDLSPSSFITVDIDELSDLSPDHQFDRLDGSKFGSAEANVAVSYLKRALNQDLDGLVLDLLLLELLRVRLMKEECLSEMYTSKVSDLPKCYPGLAWGLKRSWAFRGFKDAWAGQSTGQV
ncbi:hypothetical protein ACOSQ4_028538 [Xanthoceras sorbifolium]